MCAGARAILRGEEQQTRFRGGNLTMLPLVLQCFCGQWTTVETTGPPPESPTMRQSGAYHVCKVATQTRAQLYGQSMLKRKHWPNRGTAVY